MRLKPSLIVLVLLVFAAVALGKRSRGRSRGTSSSSSIWSTRKSENKKGDAPKAAPPPPKPVPPPKPAPQPKPSAPVEPAKAPVQESAIRRDNANLQQSSPDSGRPIGWNVDGPASGQNVGFKTGHPSGSNFEPHKQQNVNPSQSGNLPGGYSNSGYGQNSGAAYPNSGAAHPNSGAAYPNSGAAYPNSGAAHPNSGAAYPNSGVAYPNSGAAYPNSGGQNPYNPQQPYPGYYPTSNIGVVPPRGADAGHYYNSQAGYGTNPVFVNQQNQGLMGGRPGYGGYGGGYGGNNGGYGGGNGGYGGYGGYGGGNGGFGGGYGGYGGMAGYGMKKSGGGLFGKHAFRNVLGGLFVWYMISGLTSKPYHVYNYYNQPKEEREEISLPANILTLCNENVTSLCVPGTTAICTTNNTILCVTTMATVAPCKENNGELCVNSTIPCVDANDPICQNSTNKDNTTTVSLPCFTNMTIDSSLGAAAGNLNLPPGDNKFCVTTMAVPDNSNSTSNGTEVNMSGSAPVAGPVSTNLNANEAVNATTTISSGGVSSVGNNNTRNEGGSDGVTLGTVLVAEDATATAK